MSSKLVIVTGASGGIGRATALEFARDGADLILQYHSNRVAAEKVAREINSLGHEALLAQVNFSDVKESPRQVQSMVETAVSKFGKVDFLLNLAGYSAKGEWNRRFLELSPDDFFKPINVDLFGSFLCARAVAPQFLKQKKGVIVNVSSTPALGGHDRGFAFTVAKAGVIGLTKALAVELAPYVRVNTVALGNVETEWVEELTGEELEREKGENLIKRFGKPEEIAKILCFLCSDDSTFINGQTIVLDGGSILH
ncbi:MAG: SDR family oxidoreductase [Candidatus Bathyarchaeia archaeon]|jgi:3-oxoacyl-[acyl-carrier protein] reductase